MNNNLISNSNIESHKRKNNELIGDDHELERQENELQIQPTSTRSKSSKTRKLSDLLDNNEINSSDNEIQSQVPSRFRSNKDSNGSISWVSRISKWSAMLKINSVDYIIGYYDTEEEARNILASASTPENLLAISNELNTYNDINMKRLCFSQYIQKHIDPKRKVHKSYHRGVSWSERDKKWIAQITLDGIKFHIGSYDDEEKADAVRQVIFSHKETLLEFLSKVNDRKEKLQVFADYVNLHCESCRSIPTSKFDGIHSTRSRSENGDDLKSWHACIRILNERYRLGSYDSEERAHEMLSIIKQENHLTMLTNILKDIPNRSERLSYFAKYVQENIDHTKKLSNRRLNGRTSIYDGVYKTVRSYEKHEANEKWRSAIRIFGKLFLG